MLTHLRVLCLELILDSRRSRESVLRVLKLRLKLLLLRLQLLKHDSLLRQRCLCEPQLGRDLREATCRRYDVYLYIILRTYYMHVC